jgi:hypothetical protein
MVFQHLSDERIQERESVPVDEEVGELGCENMMASGPRLTLGRWQGSQPFNEFRPESFAPRFAISFRTCSAILTTA